MALKPLSSTKVKNYINGVFPSFQCDLHNIYVNGEFRGCSGFITNPINEVVVYLNTEPSVYRNAIYCRFADDTKDYTGARNHTVDTQMDLLNELGTMLTNREMYEREMAGHTNRDIRIKFSPPVRENDEMER